MDVVTIISWTPQNVLGPIIAAHVPATAAAVLAAKAAAPKLTGALAASIRAYATGPLMASIDPFRDSSVDYAGAVMSGSRPHTIEASEGGGLTTPFGVFASVQHPGTAPNQFMGVAGPAYRAVFFGAAGAGLRVSGLVSKAVGGFLG